VQGGCLCDVGCGVGVDVQCGVLVWVFAVVQGCVLFECQVGVRGLLLWVVG